MPHPSLRRIIFVLAISIVVFTGPFISCHKSDTESHPAAAGKSFTKLVILDKQLDARNISIYRGETPAISGRQTAGGIGTLYAELANGGVNSIISLLKANLSGDVSAIPQQPYTLILYSTEGDSITNINSIYGISYMTIENNALSHRFLKVVDGNAGSLREYNVSTGYITRAELDYFALEFRGSSSSYGYTMLKNLDVSAAGLQNNSTDNALGRAIVLTDTDIIPAEDSKGCAAKPIRCSNVEKGFCKFDVAWYCTYDGCRLATVKAEGEENNLTDPDDPLSFDEAYFFRDSLMKNYSVLRKYIDYYYTLSYIGNTFNTLSSDNLADHVSMAYKVVSALRNLKNSSGNPVIIDSSFQALALSLIADYRQASSNKSYQDMLDDITADLNHYTGKTRSQVLIEIQ
jgi:hypothetical protein